METITKEEFNSLLVTGGTKISNLNGAIEELTTEFNKGGLFWGVIFEILEKHNLKQKHIKKLSYYLPQERGLKSYLIERFKTKVFNASLKFIVVDYAIGTDNKEAEQQKEQLENKGYNLISTAQIGLNKYKLTYKKGKY